MAQIFDVPTGPVQRSMTGSPLDAAVPGAMFDPADMARRQAASSAGDQILSNPALHRKTPSNNAMAVDLGMALPYDVEGLLRSVAMKYGIDAAKTLMEKMPTMSQNQLMAIYKLVKGAASESDSMNERERMAYERAGMQYRQGQYVPK